MRFLVFVLLSLLLAFVASWYVAAGNGRAAFTVAGWTVQTSFNFFILVTLVLFLLLYALLRSLVKLKQLPAQVLSRRRHKRQGLSEQGLLALVAGDWAKAETCLAKASGSLLDCLGAARAAQQQSKADRCDGYLAEARKAYPSAQAMIAMAEAELQCKQGRKEQALATLNHSDGSPQAKAMRLQLCGALGYWDKVLALLPELRRAGLLSAAEMRVKQTEAYAGLVRQAGHQADALWAGLPKRLRSQASLIKVYTQTKLKGDDASACEPLLRKALKRQWDDDLGTLYGLVAGEDRAEQLKFAESLLTKHPARPVLLIALARLSRQNELWGKARAYFEQGLSLQPTAETHYELAGLLEQQGEHAAAALHYKQGLALVVDIALSD